MMMESSDFLREIGRIVAGGFYDYQEVRIGIMNRLRDIVRKKNEGIGFNEVEDKKDKKEYDDKYSDAKMPKLLKKMIEEKKLSDDESKYINTLIELLKESVKNEQHYKNIMNGYVQTERIYSEFLYYIKGISTILSANLIKNFGYCEKYAHISSLWKHCGLHVVNGAAPKRRKGENIDYNPKLRVFCWKIADSFIKQRTPYYRDVYDAEKTRLTNMGAFSVPFSARIKGDLLGADYGKMKDGTRITKAAYDRLAKTMKEGEPIMIRLSKGHIDARAKRKMVKIFLAHYWLKAHAIMKLPITKPYVIEKLGHSHFTSPDEVIEMSMKKAKGM